MDDRTVIPIPLPARQTQNDQALELKWGKAVVDYGFTVLPTLLLQGQQRLGLSAMQLNVLMQLLDHWWDPTSKIYPSKRTIAERIGVTPRSVQKTIAALEQAGFVNRIRRKTVYGDPNTNIYDLSGLIKKLKKLEPEFKKAREERRQIQREVETPVGRRKGNI